MSKPQDQKTLKEKLLSKLPKLPAFRLKLPDMKWAEKRAKVKAWSVAAGGRISGHAKTAWGKTSAFLKKYRADVIFTSIVVGATYVAVSGLSYLSNRDSRHPSVTFTEEGKNIIVYPAISKLYVEEGREYFMADYNRKTSCEGVLVRVPAWLSHRKDGKMYSMKTCRAFNAAAGDAAHMDENVQKYGKYIDLARKQAPKP